MIKLITNSGNPVYHHPDSIISFWETRKQDKTILMIEFSDGSTTELLNYSIEDLLEQVAPQHLKSTNCKHRWVLTNLNQIPVCSICGKTMP